VSDTTMMLKAVRLTSK